MFGVHRKHHGFVFVAKAVVVRLPPLVVRVNSWGHCWDDGDGGCDDHRDVCGGTVVQSGGVRRGDVVGGGYYYQAELDREMEAKLKSPYACLRTLGANYESSSMLYRRLTRTDELCKSRM